MNLDRDLRDALRPLGGDPIADAARVLAALPPGPPAGPPTGAPQAPRGPARPWLPWTLLAVGSLGGFALGRAFAPADPAAVAPPVTTPNLPVPTQGQPIQPPEQPKDPPDKPAIDVGFVGAASDHLTVMAFGELAVDEPKSGHQELDPGSWMTELGTRFTTQGQAGIYVNANDVRIRLDVATTARVDVDRIDFEAGRLWVDTGQRQARVQVGFGDAKLVFVDAAGIVTRDPTGVHVTGLSGTIEIDTPSDRARVAAHERLTIAADGGVGPRTKVPFLPTATSWMTTMIASGLDQRELDDRVQTVFAAYEQGEFRAAARREILALGSRCVWLLADSVERRFAADHDYALQTVDLLGRLVEFRSAPYVLSLLLLDDADLRERVFAALRDATDTDAGTDAAFWRDASLDARRAAIERWRAELTR